MEALAKKYAEEKKPRQKQESRLLPELFDAQENMRARLGTKVKISGSEKKGKIVIEYFSKDDLERIYEIIGGEPT